MATPQTTRYRSNGGVDLSLLVNTVEPTAGVSLVNGGAVVDVTINDSSNQSELDAQMLVMGFSPVVGGTVTAGGPPERFDRWGATGVATSASGVTLPVLGGVGVTEVIVTRAAVGVQLAVWRGLGAVTGTLTATLIQNGVATAVVATMNAGGGDTYAVANASGISIASGDRFSVQVGTDGSWNGTMTPVSAGFEVSY